jgi:VIT1/CCC1 family predicted Fe2+/Mn2+ transporter
MGAIESWGEEKESAYLYRVLAEAEPAADRRTLFAQLAIEAEKQAAIWEGQARKSGATPALVYVPSWRARLVARLVRRLGPERMRAVLAAMKVRGMSIYSDTEAEHSMPTSIEEVGRRHRATGASSLRAAVFGVNDGLVSNASLILGVAGATGVSQHTEFIVISGVAGLLAGACSMAAGEYVSIRSQREMFERQISMERDELKQYPVEEAAELALIYEARGLEKEDAARMATRIVANPERALDTLAREELGLDPGALGSPWLASASSFAAFALGALVPLAPFLISSGQPALLAAVAVTAASLFAVGSAISLFTGKSALWSGARMLLIGSGAAAITFLIGHLLGVNPG